jgi:hypothetical protein
VRHARRARAPVAFHGDVDGGWLAPLAPPRHHVEAALVWAHRYLLFALLVVLVVLALLVVRALRVKHAKHEPLGWPNTSVAKLNAGMVNLHVGHRACASPALDVGGRTFGADTGPYTSR